MFTRIYIYILKISIDCAGTFRVASIKSMKSRGADVRTTDPEGRMSEPRISRGGWQKN